MPEACFPGRGSAPGDWSVRLHASPPLPPALRLAQTGSSSRVGGRVTPTRFGPSRPGLGGTMPAADASRLNPPVTRRAAPRLRVAWHGGLPREARALHLHTLRLYPRACTWGFGVWCPLPRPVGLLCDCCSSAHRFALRLPFHGRSPCRSCLRLVLAVFSQGAYGGSRPGDFHPMSSRPCRAYPSASPDRYCAALHSGR